MNDKDFISSMKELVGFQLGGTTPSMLADRIDNLIDELQNVIDPEQSADANARMKILGLDDIMNQISSVVAKTNKFFAVQEDSYIKRAGVTNPLAAERIMQIRNPYLIKTIEQDARYGEDADKVRKVEFRDFMKDAKNEIVDPMKIAFENLKKEFGGQRASYAIRTMNKLKANERVMQVSDPKQYRDIVGRRQYGKEWERVKKAEDAANAPSVIEGISKASKAIGAFTAGIAAGYSMMTKWIRFVNESNVGITKFSSQLHSMNRLFSVSANVMTAFATTGMDAVKASGAAGQLDVFAAGLPYGRGMDKLAAMSMAGIDISGINPMEDTGEDIIRKIAPQIQNMSARERARVLALGALSPEMMRAAQTYGKDFWELDEEEQINAQRSAWQEKVNRMRKEAYKLGSPIERKKALLKIKALEDEGPDAWSWNEEEYGQTWLEMQMEQQKRQEEYDKPEILRNYEKRKERARDLYIASRTKKKSVVKTTIWGGADLVPKYVPPTEEEMERWEERWSSKHPSPDIGVSAFPSTSETKNITVDMSGATFNVTGDNATDISQDILSQVSDGIVVAIQNNEEK